MALARQREYASRRRVPWGISECAHNAVDRESNARRQDEADRNDYAKTVFSRLFSDLKGDNGNRLSGLGAQFLRDDANFLVGLWVGIADLRPGFPDARWHRDCSLPL